MLSHLPFFVINMCSCPLRGLLRTPPLRLLAVFPKSDSCC